MELTISDSFSTPAPGVFAVDLGRWKLHKLTEEAEFWMKQTLDKKLWDYGSQPVWPSFLPASFPFAALCFCNVARSILCLATCHLC